MDLRGGFARGTRRVLRPLKRLREPGWLVRVGPRLAVAFLLVSALLPVIGLIAEREQRLAAARDARVEAQHLARVIADDVADGADTGRPLDPAKIRPYLDNLRRQIGGDVEIVDLRRDSVADTMPAGAARLGADPDGKIAATLRDGLVRTITRDDAGVPLKLVVVPIRTPADGVVGALVLDYTALYDQVMSAGASSRRLTLAAGLAGMAVALGLGWALSRGLVRDVRRLTQAAGMFAEGHYGTRAQVKSRGELRELAQALNAMAERIAERKAVLVDLATTDPLTGLPNRRALRAGLARDLDHARRRGTPLSLILLDLDHFKAINDEHGHLTGDAVLRRVGEILQAQVRSTDLAARHGGEEFAVLLPDTGRDSAMRTAERVRAALSAAAITFQGHSVKVTASLGVVAYPEHGRTIEDLVRRADAALYHAKRAGRDQVHSPPVT
ncbi:GGDEF domain-containing protein [Catellatospora sichuanensis]|uniref:GGDEF domain-containing protein n=1 Tax=Catellatospora sichuanensis TaxID=1969805 RepID=UPI00118307B9|nr:GGDEF domain-containing protein [Catellatospora sichuanensis]